MASSTPTSSPHNEQHNPHPYAIKTSHTGLLTRSNSSKAHGSWSKHHYTPVPPSPSAFVFDPPESSPGPTRRRQARPSSHVQHLHASPSSKSPQYESPRGSEKHGSMSPSQSKYSRSWVGRNSEGEQVNLPRHPYLWNPPQLGTYLSSVLSGSDGDPLDSDVIKAIVDFIQQRKIGGRAFLNLDQEDFQEMEGVNSLWSNALWDASSTMRQGITPYRPSRISSSVYKRGRVRGVVDFFERSASESSDAGEDDAHSGSPGKVILTDIPPARKRPRKTTQKWDISESEDKLSKSAKGAPQYSLSQDNSTSGRDLEVPLSRELYKNAGTSTAHMAHDRNLQISSSANAVLDLNESPTHPYLSGVPVDDNLAVVIPPQSGSPVNLVLGPGEIQFQVQGAIPPEPDLPDDNTSHNSREVVVSIHRREMSEPTMAELYEQTYGAPPPSSRSEHPVPQALSDDDGAGETVKIVAATTSSNPPPTALRPIVQRRTTSPPPSLRRLFLPSSVLQAASDTESQSVYILPASGSEGDEAAVRTLSVLKERLTVVERRLEAMELKDAEENIPYKVVSRYSRSSRRTSLPVENDLDELDLELHSSRSAEALRSWQSAYILLAGATTGVSVVLIPMLLRHLWSR